MKQESECPNCGAPAAVAATECTYCNTVFAPSASPPPAAAKARGAGGWVGGVIALGLVVMVVVPVVFYWLLRPSETVARPGPVPVESEETACFACDGEGTTPCGFCSCKSCSGTGTVGQETCLGCRGGGVDSRYVDAHCRECNNQRRLDCPMCP